MKKLLESRKIFNIKKGNTEIQGFLSVEKENLGPLFIIQKEIDIAYFFKEICFEYKIVFEEQLKENLFFLGKAEKDLLVYLRIPYENEKYQFKHKNKTIFPIASFILINLEKPLERYPYILFSHDGEKIRTDKILHEILIEESLTFSTKLEKIIKRIRKVYKI